ncbi:hypothetical protein AAFC00_005472 [Neodothiora populina]|uniref:BRCT domain-containing protein n=1 Tax=Neodothiora populina TaxID=2781224 RepID=A0ABR3PL92_9PEZI
MGDQTSALFWGVDYTIIPSDTIDTATQDELHSILQTNQAQFIPLRSPDGRVDQVRAHTHIIADSVDFPDYNAALDASVHVVKPSWVFSSVEKKRQSQIRQHSPDPAMFFSQVTLSCAELPEGDKDAVIAGVIAMGGLYSNPLTKLVTHIVTLSDENDKCKVARERMPECRIVLPHWFDDCFRLGKLIDETPYRFPDPEILRLNNSDPVKIRQTPDIEGATSAVAGEIPVYQPPESPSPSRKQLSVLQGKRVFFSHDLKVNDHLAKTLRSIVGQAGGEMATSVDECDVYIGHYRDGPDYIAASQADREVANLAWFYNVINRNRWTNPLSKLLHYPIPRNGIPGFKDMRISLSNYTGEARIYLENLVKEAGAEFTKTMKQDNTHLITAHKQSEKCDAALEWNIHIINHLWLEESYAKCAVQSMTAQRYTHFPPRTNLTEIVGQTPIHLDTARRLYCPQKQRAAVPPQQRSPSRKTVPSTKPAAPSHEANAEEGEDDGDDDQDDNDQHEEDTTPAPVTKPNKTKGRKASVSTTIPAPAEATTPMPARTKKDDGKENETPSTSGRASKTKALDQMHRLKDDIALFEKEMKRKGGVVHGGRRSVTADGGASPVAAGPKKGGTTTTATGKGRKRASAEANGHVDEDGDSDAGNGKADEDQVTSTARPVGRPSKKAKKNERDGSVVAEHAPSLPRIKYKMLVTGESRWQSKPKSEGADAKKLRHLGVLLTQDPLDCNILCAPSIKRTQKFVCALAGAPTVVSTSYLDYLLKTSSEGGAIMRDPIEDWLVDRDFEAKYALSLDDALERAKTNKRQLLRGWNIFFTEKVGGGFETWKNIVGANGGTATLYRGRPGGLGAGGKFQRRSREQVAQTPNQGVDAGQRERDRWTVYLVSGSDDEEVKLWKGFRSQVEKLAVDDDDDGEDERTSGHKPKKMQARIVSTEWVLHCALAQRIEWKDEWETKEG